MNAQFNPILKEVIAESNMVAIAFGDKTNYIEHFVLAMLKVAPDDVAVKYMETVMPSEAWLNYLQEIAKNKVALSKKGFLDFILPKTSHAWLSGELQEALKLCYLEAKNLETDDINLACMLLSILRHKNFDGKLEYSAAQHFIKNSL